MPDDRRHRRRRRPAQPDEGILPSGYLGADEADRGAAGAPEEGGGVGSPGGDAGFAGAAGYADGGGAGYPDDGGDAGLAGGPTRVRTAVPLSQYARQTRRPSSTRVRRRRHVAATLLVVVVLVITVVAGGVLWGLHQINPGGKLGRDVTVTIPRGASTDQIASRLAAAGVIHDATVFRLYTKIEGSGPLLAGTYRMATNESYQRAIGILEAGPAIVVDTLVIPEGFTLRQIAARVAALPGMHLSAKAFLALSSSGSVRSPYEPAGVDNLEGLVFPATYQVSQGESESDILEDLVMAFDERADAINLTGAAAKLHMTPYQVVTVASIVQGEAKFDSDRPDVASAIYNRLASGMTLGADSTLIYALRRNDPNLNVNDVNYEEPSPYNTRLHTGLPPTPIDSPGLPSLQAAATPPHTDYLYFVEINPDGKLGFATDNAGFVQLEAECDAAKLC